MKNIKNILIGIALFCTLTSCSSFLDQSVKGQETIDSYFKNEAECLKQLTGCYQSIFWDGWWQLSSFYVGSDMCTDDMWMGNTSQSQSDWVRMAHYGNPKQDGPIKNFWQYRFNGILRCNNVIEKVATAPILDEELRARIIAEAKVIRAFHYFELVKNYGGVPILLKMTYPEQIIGVERNTIAETYAQVESDLLAAIEVLPLRSEYLSSDLGRVTKGMAMGYLGKAYLYQEKFVEAEAVLKKLIGSGEYSLLPNFKDVWSIEFNNSTESLFEVQYSGDINYSLGGRLPVFTGSRDDEGWAWSNPTSNLESAFIDAGDEIRLKWTIVKDGEDVPGDDDEKAQGYLISPSKHKSARINRKFYVPQVLRPEPYDSDHNRLNHRLLRYADVLLMYAEAANELGMDEESRIYLNQVRNRVNLPAVTTSGKSLRDDIRLERRLELACEHQRLYDIRRWVDDNGKKAICNIMGPNGSFVQFNAQSTDPYESTNQRESSRKGETFREDRDLLFPIPNSDFVLSEGSLKQNPNF